MPIAFTSREALPKITALLGRQHRQVFDFIARWTPDEQGAGPSIADIGDGLNIQHGAASRAIHGLLKDGCIELAAVKQNMKSGLRVKTYRALEYRPLSAPAPCAEKDGQGDFFTDTKVPSVSPYQTRF